MSVRFRPTLGQVFALALVVLVGMLGLLYAIVDRGSKASILEAAERQRDERAQKIGQSIAQYLGHARTTLEDIEGLLRTGALPADGREVLEAALFATVNRDRDLSEITFTHAVGTGWNEDDEIVLAPAGRWQLSVFRAPQDGGEAVYTRYDHPEGGRFVCDTRERAPKAGLLDAPLKRQSTGTVEDPTDHLTFRAASKRYNRGELLWSDLHFSQLDAALPESRQRVVMTVQKAVEDAQGHYLGVVRVGFLVQKLDGLVEDAGEGLCAFLCDNRGRLLTRLAPGDRIAEVDGDLRVVPAEPQPEVSAALALPVLREIGRETGQKRAAGARVLVQGEAHLVSFRFLPESQDWIVGVVAPESAYLGTLEATRKEVTTAALGVIAVIVLGGILVLRGVQRSLGRIVDTTARMRAFDFTPGEVKAPFRDVQQVIERLEMAKTAMRAMGKYVPVDLVRILFQSNREPELGGEIKGVTVMFTDIADFTTHSERLSPNDLARALGRYLDVMTEEIHGTHGIIDKYIGDAVMAVWNVPTAVADHPVKACEAALRCQEATARLEASADWSGLPRFHTRFGLHCDDVMVGHFGSPNRMSFTALGDGVNLASRLEGLNKQYGTTVIVSEAVRTRAGEGFVFRRLDRVAVKGKSRGVEIHELVGRAGAHPLERTWRDYERALELCWTRAFAEAAALLEAHPDDGPSRMLLERCRRLIADPPPADWDGIYVSKTK